MFYGLIRTRDETNEYILLKVWLLKCNYAVFAFKTLLYKLLIKQSDIMLCLAHCSNLNITIHV